MEDLIPSMTRLFAQLGLSSDAEAINAFITAHRPLSANLALADAPFWTASQSEFLRSEVVEDSDWSIVIERLNATLRMPQ